MLHHFSARAVATDGESAADDLAEGPHVGLNAEPLGRATASQTEAGDDLVKEQHRSGSVASLSQPFEETLAWSYEAHVGRYRFHGDNRDGVVDFGHDVERCNDGVGYCAVGYAIASGQTLLRHAAAACGEKRIGVAVVAAGEFDDRVASGRAASETNSRHCGLSTRRSKAQHLHAWDAFRDGLGEFSFANRWCAVARSGGGGRGDRLDDLGMSVAENSGAVALHEVDVTLALDVGDVGPRPALHEVRGAAD